MNQLPDGFDHSAAASIFSSKNQQQLTDDYFNESAEKISFFFEDGLVRRFFRGGEGVYYDRLSPPYNDEDFVPIEVKAGSLVVIHGDLFVKVLRIVLQNQGMPTACMWWIRKAANGPLRAGSEVDPEPLYVS